MKKNVLLLIVLFVTMGAVAQDGKRGPYLTNKFFDNWFISAGGGVGVYFGEDDQQGSFGKRIAPAFNVAVGKWITPTVGVRLQFDGIQAKGFSYGDSPYIYGGKDADGLYKSRFQMINLHADVMYDLTTAICGYKENRLYSLIPYAGFGWGQAYKSDRPTKNEITGNFGLLNRFRLCEAWDINLELRAMVVNQRFDGVSRGVKLEGNTNVSVGFAYKFNKRNFDRPVAAVEPDYSAYNRRISSLESDLADAQNKARELADALARERASKAPVQAVAASPLAIFFSIDKANLSKKEMINLGYLAETIKNCPDKKFKLQASADEQTGSSKWNQKLSEKRAQAVYDALVKKYNVNPDQLIIDAIGGQKNNPYDEPYLNRVVLIKQ